MKFSEALLIIKEFFLEVLGFLIPGLVMLLLPILILENKAQESAFTVFDKEYHLYIVILFAYILGYSIYGASEMLEKVKWDPEKGWLRKFMSFCFFSGFVFKLEKSIRDSAPFNKAKSILKGLNAIDNIESEFTVRQIRNLSMSFISKSMKSDIYTFTFRSDLCRHLSTVLKFYTIMSIILATLYLNTGVRIFLREYIAVNKAWNFLLFTVFFFIFIILFENTRRRFYSIAHRIQYPMFISTIKSVRPPKKNEE